MCLDTRKNPKKIMLDLNLDMISSESSSSCEDTQHKNKNFFLFKEKELASTATLMEEDSGNSNSSIIINNFTDEAVTNQADFETNSAAFIFDILKKEDNNNNINNFFTNNGKFSGFLKETKNSNPNLQDFRQKFGMELEPTKPQQWLKLEPSGEAELKIVQQKQQQMRKSRRGPRSKSSQYRGVTFYRRTGRWESHIWDCGKQVYLGGFDTALAAARAYDRAAIKFRGVEADINFDLADYDDDMKQMKNLSKEEFVQILRRQSTGFARGSSKYRGVTLHKCGEWEARIGQFHGKKTYDMTAIKCNGSEAVTNLEPPVYEGGIIFDPDNEGNGHNLELSLGISIPTNDSKRNHSTCNFGCIDSELPNKDRLMANPNASTPKNVHNFLNLPPAFKFPGLADNNQEMAGEKKAEANASPKTSNWAWQINANNNTNNNVAKNSLVAAAASSRFASSAIFNYLPIQ